MRAVSTIAGMRPRDADNACVLFHAALWQKQSQQLKEVFKEFADDLEEDREAHLIELLEMEVTDETVGMAKQCRVEKLPALLVFDRGGGVVDTNDCCSVPGVVDLLRRVVSRARSSAAAAAPAATAASNELDPVVDRKLERLVNFAPVMVFMKGSRAQPYCKFSKMFIALMDEHYPHVEFGVFDIFQDEEARQGLKKKFDWPTFPQLYVKGELQGGIDIVKEMHEAGELDELFPAEAKREQSRSQAQETQSLEDKLRSLVKAAPVMLFMKGAPQSPQCGFSRTIVGILDKLGVEYSHFNILADDEVRQGLKAFADWPTYPQLYSGGQFLGGLDIVKELDEEGELLNEIEQAQQ